VRPVGIRMSDPRLVLAVSGGRTPQGVGQVGGRSERGCSGVGPTGGPRRGLLQPPAVTVGILERSEGTVTASLRIRARDSAGRPCVVKHAATVREPLGPGGSTIDQSLASDLHVGNYQVKALGRSRGGQGETGSEDDRTRRAR